MNIGFAQGAKFKAKTKKVEKTTVQQPKTEQPKIEQQQTVQQPTEVQPTTVEVQNTEVKESRASHGLSLSFGYDFLAKFKKTQITSNGDTTLDSFSSSDESAKYMDLKLSFSFLSSAFRFGFGLGFILPRDYDNKFTYLEKTEGRTNVPVKFKQELNLGTYIQLFQFGYRVDLNYVELVPYAGLNVLYLQAEDSFDSQDIVSGTTKIHKVTIPINAGLDVIFADVGPMSFYAGLEIGYAIKVVYEYSSEGWRYFGTYGKRITDNSDPLTGLMGKITLGTSFNF